MIGEQQMKELGMNAYLAVGAGSHNESLMSVIEYKGSSDADARPIVLVGKGLTLTPAASPSSLPRRWMR